MRCNRTAKAGLPNTKTLCVCFTLLAAFSCTKARPDPAQYFASIKTLYQQGRFAQARQSAEAEYRSLNPQSEWYWKFRLLFTELLLFNGETGKAERLLNTPPPPKPASLLPRYEMLQAYWLFARERGKEAEAKARQARADAHQTGDYETISDTDLLLANYLADPQKAEQASRAALVTASDRGLPYQQAAALLDLGLVELRRSHYGDATQIFEKASVIAERTGAVYLRAAALDNLATCRYNVGDLQSAANTLHQLLPVQRQCGLNPGIRDSYLELGNLYLLQRDSETAIQNFRAAMTYVNKKDEPGRFAMISAGIAQALVTGGSLDEGERYNNQALATADPQDRSQLAEIRLNQGDLWAKRRNHENAIRGYLSSLALGADTPSVVWRAHAGLALEYAQVGNVQKATKSFDRALSVIERNRSEQLSKDYQITFLSELIRFYQDYVTFLIGNGEGSEALDVADSSRAAVLRESLTGTAQVPVDKVEARTRTVAHRASCIFLFYWLAPKQSFLWVIGPNTTKVVPLPPEQSIRQDVESYSYLIQQEKIDPLTNPHGVGKRLYDTLIAPACIPKGSRVVIVPDGALHSLNFETLPIYSPTSHYWVDDVTLSIAPSLSVVNASAANARSTGALLLIGDTVTDGTGFPPLPQSAHEIQNIKSHFPSVPVTLYKGSSATVQAYMYAHPERFRYIHFATHADANEQSPLDSAIILSPRQNAWKLFARDVAEIPLRADLVTISACRSAGARTLAGEGLVGFAWAFFQAGARNVVTSLWNVNDQSTAGLMDDFYAQVSSGKSYAAALRSAKLAVMRRGYQKPYYWGPFQLSSRYLANGS